MIVRGEVSALMKKKNVEIDRKRAEK